jgi:hypothetical protein
MVFTKMWRSEQAMYEWQGDLHNDNMTILHGTIHG